MKSPLRFAAALVFAPALALFGGPVQIMPQAATFLGFDTTGTIQPAAYYTFGGNGWVTTNNPLTFESASQLDAEGLENTDIQTLTNAFSADGWIFNYASGVTLADNTFQVETYDAQAPGPPSTNYDAYADAALNNPFSQSCVINNNCVGDEFYFNYNATGDDPTDNLHWIQVVSTNTGGSPETVVDNGTSSSPYYDASGAANSSGFLDLPGVNSPGTANYFDAELYLVSGPVPADPGVVTIYGALDWGWSNTMTPEPSTIFLLSGGLALMAFAKLRAQRS